MNAPDRLDPLHRQRRYVLGKTARAIGEKYFVAGELN
jgi:acyl-homoserine lactone acylase PvdQ